MPTEEDKRKRLRYLQLKKKKSLFEQQKIEPVVEPEEEPVAKPSYLSGVGDLFTKDIPQTFQGAGERISKRTQRIDAPTELGVAAQKATGTKGLLGEFVEGTAGLPERLTRTVSGAVGTLGEVVGVPVEIATKGINRILGGKPGELIQKAVSKGVNSEAGKKVVEATSKWWEGLPQEDKANYGSIPDILDGIGIKGGRVIKPSLSPKELENIVKSGISKGIKPTVIGKTTLPKFEGFFKQSEKAVKTILENQNVIKLTDEFGESIPIPRSSAEFAKAIEATKGVIYKKYHGLAVSAGDKKAQFDFNPISKKLDEVISGPKKKKLTPDARVYAAKLKEELSELHGELPDIIEARIKDLNSSLAKFYEGRINKATAEIDASVANLMREELNNKITKAVGGQYSELKKQYGSLLAIEQEVNKRALVNARKAGKSVMDMTDIFTSGDLTAGILTLNPALVSRGVAGRMLKEFYRHLNDPDKSVKEMFLKANKITLPSQEKFRISPQILRGLPVSPTTKGVARGLSEEDIENLSKLNFK